MFECKIGSWSLWKLTSIGIVPYLEQYIGLKKICQSKFSREEEQCPLDVLNPRIFIHLLCHTCLTTWLLEREPVVYYSAISTANRQCWVYTKCCHWIRCKRTRTCHLFCKRPGWYHSTSKSNVWERERIFKLSLIHTSVIFRFPEFTNFTEFNESSALFRKNPNESFISTGKKSSWSPTK